MITREDYNKALDVVEAYHKQLFIGGVGSSLTPISEWCKWRECSTRLRNVLLNIRQGTPSWVNYQEDFIENIRVDMMRRFPNCGKRSLDEFKELRGY